jgi:hypothetical protein
LNNIQKHSGATRVVMGASRLEAHRRGRRQQRRLPFSGSFSEELELLRLGSVSTHRVKMLEGDLTLDYAPRGRCQLAAGIPL